MKDRSEEDKKRNRKIIMMIVLLIIIILSLISSCSCTSDLWGKIGDIFSNEGSTVIKPGTNDKTLNRNDKLLFDEQNVRIPLSNNKYKLSFSHKNIIPGEITCTTSDAKIAVCYVEDGHVIIVPKGEGTVKVTIKTETNDTIYEADTDVTITEAEKYIRLSSKNGSLDLKNSNTKKFTYTLVGMTGTPKVTVSDASIASATIKNGVVTIQARKTGTVSVTLSLTYNDKVYKATYTLRIKDTSSEGKPNEGGNTEEPTNPNKPEDPTQPEDPVKNTDNYIESLTHSCGVIDPDFKKTVNNYEIFVKDTDDKISLDMVLSDKATATYKVNDKVVESLNDVGLNYGDNKITVIVTSESGATNEYTFTVKRPNPVDLDDYFVSSPKTQYDMFISSASNTRDIILNTNLFVGPVSVQNIPGGIRVISKVDATVYMDITTNSPEISKIEYTGELTGPTSLPIKVTAVSDGTANIQASIYKDGSMLDSENITLNIESGFVLILDANGGKFDDEVLENKFVLSKNSLVDLINKKITKDGNTIIDLSRYKDPYMETDNECLVYAFKGYSLSKTKGSPIIDVVLDITADTTIYAMYEDTPTDKTEVVTKSLYIVDIPLFKNDEYFNKYGKDYIIYPGAYGSYVEHITNDTDEEMTFTNLQMEEETICIPGEGCLNMAYIVKHADGPFYYMGSYQNGIDEYELLNGSETVINGNRGNTIKDFDMEANNQTITLAPGETKAISIFWKWVEVNDRLDTKIGEYANKAKTDLNINDKYTLYMKLDYKTNKKECN